MGPAQKTQFEMRWRHFRCQVTHCELLETKQALNASARQFFDRYNQCPEKILSVIGSNAEKVARRRDIISASFYLYLNEKVRDTGMAIRL